MRMVYSLMDRIESKIKTRSPEFQDNTAHMAALVDTLKKETSAARLGGPEASRGSGRFR